MKVKFHNLAKGYISISEFFQKHVFFFITEKQIKNKIRELKSKDLAVYNYSYKKWYLHENKALAYLTELEKEKAEKILKSSKKEKLKTMYTPVEKDIRIVYYNPANDEIIKIEDAKTEEMRHIEITLSDFARYGL